MIKYLWLALLLMGCGNAPEIILSPDTQIELRIDRFRTLYLDKQGDNLRAYLKCYEGYSLSKITVLNQDLDCDAEEINGKSMIILDVGQWQKLILDLIGKRCI